jgi:hypothetical protein
MSNLFDFSVETVLLDPEEFKIINKKGFSRNSSSSKIVWALK